VSTSFSISFFLLILILTVEGMHNKIICLIRLTLVNYKMIGLRAFDRRTHLLEGIRTNANLIEYADIIVQSNKTRFNFK
jgi:hypothetical protein